MSKTIVIGDVHGLKNWKKFLRWNFRGKVIFLGDYCDPYGKMPEEELLQNLRDIIAYKKKHMKRVVLLLGNHDMHYITSKVPVSSRFNINMYSPLSQLFYENRSLFQYAYQDGHTLFTHAGISQAWWDEFFHGDSTQNIADQLNNVDDEQLAVLGQVGYARGGNTPWGGIFWADASEMRHPLSGYHQVIGHTRKASVTHEVVDDATSVTFCDCLFNDEVYKF